MVKEPSACVYRHSELDKKIRGIEKTNELQEERINNIHEALFGVNGGKKGMETKLDELYLIFTGTSFTKKMVVGFIAFLASIGGLIIMVIQIMKMLRN